MLIKIDRKNDIDFFVETERADVYDMAHENLRDDILQKYEEFEDKQNREADKKMYSRMKNELIGMIQFVPKGKPIDENTTRTVPDRFVTKFIFANDVVYINNVQAVINGKKEN